MTWRMRGGYTDMGRIQIPLPPRAIIITDRADGTKWWVTYNLSPATSDGFGYISISTATPPGANTITYDAFSEPYIPIDRGFARLIIRGGYLGVEEKAPGQGITDIENLQLYARQAGLNVVVMKLILASTTDAKGALYAFSPYTFVQTANPR